MDIQWSDNTKARVLDRDLSNKKNKARRVDGKDGGKEKEKER